jgi:hypothetical protein
MSFAIKKRIARIEDETGIKEPCAVCEVTSRYCEKLIAVRKLPPASPALMVNRRCAWCGCPYSVNMGDYGPELAKEWEECLALHDAGKYCDPKVQARYEGARARMEERSREIYGPEYTAIIQEAERAMDEVTRALPLRIPYVCTVEGCTCGAKAA